MKLLMITVEPEKLLLYFHNGGQNTVWAGSIAYTHGRHVGTHGGPVGSLLV